MEKEKRKIQVNGLKTLPKDERDFKLGAIFSLVDPQEIPHETFMVVEPRILDQKETDFCTGYSVASASGDQEMVEMSPEYQFAKTKQLEGSIGGYGADLRTAVKSSVRFGSLPKKYADEYMLKRGIEPFNHASVANWKNWSSALDVIAEQYKKETYFKVSGKGDIFDDIRATLWTFRMEPRTVIVGALWRDSWTNSIDGFIENKSYEDEDGFGHAFKIIGQKVRENGDIYLVAQLSNGEQIGDKGLFYFPRRVVNTEFAPYGQFILKDMPRDIAEKCQKYSFKYGDPWYVKLFIIIINFLKK